LQQWIDFAQANPEGCLYCFRGGQRSKVVQQWLAEEGLEYPRVSGGYKAMRQYLMAQTERLAGQFKLVLLGGRTGVGKTEVLLELPDQIDLEGLANHRGSSFGRMLDPQPSQVNFEHPLAIAMLHLEQKRASRLILEDESRSIGQRAIPTPLWQKMLEAPVIMLTDSMESRIDRTRRDYVDRMAAGFAAACPEDGFERFETHLRNSLSRISERLGGQGYREIDQLMDQAFKLQREQADTSAHEAWIARLLTDYYDPMYDYQIKNKQTRIRFSGDAAQVREFLNQNPDL
jgi:tRNA 2-selenouridine synthase